MFPGLMSRWMMPPRGARQRGQNGHRHVDTRGRLQCPGALQDPAERLPGHELHHDEMRPPSVPASYTRTRLWWASRAAAIASPRKRSSRPWSAARCVQDLDRTAGPARSPRPPDGWPYRRHRSAPASVYRPPAAGRAQLPPSPRSLPSPTCCSATLPRTPYHVELLQEGDAADHECLAVSRTTATATAELRSIVSFMDLGVGVLVSPPPGPRVVGEGQALVVPVRVGAPGRPRRRLVRMHRGERGSGRPR